MKNSISIVLLFLSVVVSSEKISQMDFLSNPDGKEFVRGEYLIILGGSGLEPSLSSPIAGNFLEFKQSQGYDVSVVNYLDIASNQNELRDYLQDYYESHPMLEYVLLVGDVTGAYSIPTHLIESYNDADYPLDQTDYPYTFFSDSDIYSPHFFIGRWSIQDQSELLNIISRTIGYSRLINPVNGSSLDSEYLNNAMIVAGNYADPPQFWPVTPVWTSQWLKDRLVDYNYSNIDEFYFTASNPNEDQTSDIGNSWSDGVGIINYRGWGDASGWKKPIFKKEHIEDLSNGWKLPVVFSFVCNTGDFGNENNETCFGEKMVKTGSFAAPKGAVAMIGPSDLDTDTKYNNVICADVWDHILEGRISELAPALHAGKQAVLREFGSDFEATGAAGTANIAEFYHHVYGVLGDPSLSVWIGEPSNINVNIDNMHSLNSSYLDVIVKDEDDNLLEGVVGALIYDDELVGKGMSNSSGELSIDFKAANLEIGSEITLYLNKDQFFQKSLTVQYLSDNGSVISESSYIYSEPVPVFTRYTVYNSFDDNEQAPEYDWIEINQLGTNLELTDDSHADISLPFSFQYYGESFNSLTISSNGWVSFIPTDINYFWNFSIPFPIGPSGMIAPFMDDLDDDDSADPDPLDVYHYYDSENNIFIIQWDEINNGEDNQDCSIVGYECVKETFQLILYDSAYHLTSTGDGDIKFQYKEIHDIDNGDYDGKWGNYSTIGIESPNQNHGVQYQFRNSLDNFGGYQWGSELIQDEMAILFTTNDVYQLEAVDSKDVFPGSIDLLSNHPNPFNPTTKILFNIDNPAYVTLIVADLRGREIARLYDNKFLNKGSYDYLFDGSNLTSGIYFYTLRIGSEIFTNKMLLLK